MNALIRKFRVASTTGVVMSLAMAGVLAMAPMGNAMAKSPKGRYVDIDARNSNPMGAWQDYLKQRNNACKSGKFDEVPNTFKQQNGNRYVPYVLKVTLRCK